MTFLKPFPPPNLKLNPQPPAASPLLRLLSCPELCVVNAQVFQNDKLEVHEHVGLSILYLHNITDILM